VTWHGHAAAPLAWPHGPRCCWLLLSATWPTTLAKQIHWWIIRYNTSGPRLHKVNFRPTLKQIKYTQYMQKTQNCLWNPCSISASNHSSWSRSEWDKLGLQSFVFLSQLVKLTFCRAIAERETRNLRAKLLLQTTTGLQVWLESFHVRLQLTARHHHHISQCVTYSQRLTWSQLCLLQGTNINKRQQETKSN